MSSKKASKARPVRDDQEFQCRALPIAIARAETGAAPVADGAVLADRRDPSHADAALLSIIDQWQDGADAIERCCAAACTPNVTARRRDRLSGEIEKLDERQLDLIVAAERVVATTADAVTDAVIVALAKRHAKATERQKRADDALLAMVSSGDPRVSEMDPLRERERHARIEADQSCRLLTRFAPVGNKARAAHETVIEPANVINPSADLAADFDALARIQAEIAVHGKDPRHAAPFNSPENNAATAEGEALSEREGEIINRICCTPTDNPVLIGRKLELARRMADDASPRGITPYKVANIESSVATGSELLASAMEDRRRLREKAATSPMALLIEEWRAVNAEWGGDNGTLPDDRADEVGRRQGAIERKIMATPAVIPSDIAFKLWLAYRMMRLNDDPERPTLEAADPYSLNISFEAAFVASAWGDLTAIAESHLPRSSLSPAFAAIKAATDADDAVFRANDAAGRKDSDTDYQASIATYGAADAKLIATPAVTVADLALKAKRLVDMMALDGPGGSESEIDALSVSIRDDAARLAAAPAGLEPSADDAPLLALCGQLRETWAKVDEVAAAEIAAHEAAQPKMPPVSDALFYNFHTTDPATGERVIVPKRWERSSVEFFIENPAGLCVTEADKERWREGMRAILSAMDDYEAARRKVYDEAGVTALDEERSMLVRRACLIETTIASAPARTLAGMLAKIAAIAEVNDTAARARDDGDREAMAMESLRADLARMVAGTDGQQTTAAS